MRRLLATVVWASFLGAALSGPSHAQSSAPVQGLWQIWQEALASDPTYAAVRFRLDAAHARVTQARAGVWLPNLSASASLTRGELSTRASTDIPEVSRTTHSYGLTLTQPLWRPQHWQDWAQSKLGVVLADVEFAEAKQELALRVAQAYFDVLAAQDALEASRLQKKAVVEQLASARRNFEVGTSTITDANEAQARFDLVTAQEISAASDLEIKRTALLQMTGQPPGELLTLRRSVVLPAPQPALLEDWTRVAEVDNLAVHAAQIKTAIAQRETSKARAGHSPTLDIVASINKSDRPLASAIDSTTTRAAGLQLNVPIFSGFATQARVSEAWALEQQARQTLEATKRQAAQTARQAFSGVTRGLAQVKALEAAEVSSQTSLNSTLLGYKVGVRVNLDVLNAQQQLFQTQRDLAKARYDTVLAGLKLKAATGVLGEEDLQAVEALLAPR